MDLEAIEKRFVSYLEAYWALSDITPFLQTYTRLLFLFRGEISQKTLGALEERQKQLRGEAFNGQEFDELRSSSRRQMGLDVRDNNDATREAMLSRMLFCALLDTEETDFFYLTEPMFEFVRKMKISPNQLKTILESEFTGFEIES